VKRLTSLLIAATCWSWASTGHGADETRYVRDWMSVPLRESQAQDSAVVHRGLVSGTVVTLLQSDQPSGLSKVRTDAGGEGWLPTRYLTTEPVARTLLDKANAELEQLRQLNQQLRGDQPTVTAAIDQANQRSEQLQQANTALTAELNELKQAPNNAANLEQSNRELLSQSETLRQQLDQATGELTQLRASRDHEMFRNGGLAVFGGVLIALLIPRLSPRKKSDWA
jgi:SH3 domain protein